MGITKLILFLVFIYQFSANALLDRPHLYKVTYNNVESYLLGTIHLGVNLSDFPQQVIDLLERTNQAYFEIDLPYAEKFRSNWEKTDFKNNIDLQTLFIKLTSDRELKIFNALLDQGVPEPLSKYLASDKNREKLYTAGGLMYLPLMYSDQVLVDAQILMHLHKTKGSDYKIQQIETDELKSVADKIESIAEGENPEYEEEMEHNLEDWLSYSPGMFKYLMDIVQEYSTGEANKDSEYDYFGGDYSIAIRNANWVMKLKKELKLHSTAVVVGVNHLYGSKGLISDLRRFGFKVERVEIIDDNRRRFSEVPD